MTIVATAAVTIVVLLPIAIPLRRRQVAKNGAIESMARLVTGTEARLSSQWSRVTVSARPGELDVRGFGPGGSRRNRPERFTLDIEDASVLEATPSNLAHRGAAARLFGLLEVRTPSAVVHLQLTRHDLPRVERELNV